MNNLILIGNGFDLSHKMKTGYGDFINCIIEEHLKDRTKYNELLNIPIGINTIDDLFARGLYEPDAFGFQRPSKVGTQFISDLLRYKKDKGNWADIESFYFRILLECKEEKEIKSLNDGFTHLKNTLQEYLSLEQNKLCKSNDAFQHIFSNLCTESSLILSFNYTNTLERLYGDEIIGTDLIYIHGQLMSENNPIIFGYAADNGEINGLLNKDDNEYLRNIKRHAYQRSNNKRRLQYYLDSNENINVFVIGHSCGLSDKLILNEIATHTNVTSIRIMYYEKYKNYSDQVINLDRIMRSESCFEKIINYQDSCRISQLSDSEAQSDAIIRYIDKLLEDEIS